MAACPVPLIERMKNSLNWVGLVAVSFCVAFPHCVCAAEPSEGTVAARSAEQVNPTAKIARTADVFLQTLDSSQRQKLVFRFDDDEQRARWSNLPTGMVPRRGLRMGGLTAPQREAAMALLAASLSPMGYEKVLGIVQADEVLRTQSRGGGPAFGKDEFYISFLGHPSETTPWMLQFGGHHLALNLTFVGASGVMTPSLIAVQPARYMMDGRTIRPLGRETDKAFELVNSLSEAQRGKAVLGFKMHDLVLGPGHDGQRIEPEGIRASELSDPQQKLLLELIQEWTGIIHAAAAAEKLTEVKARLADTWFAWSGPLESGKAAYFRVQGPTVVIEYAPQNLGGDPTQHIHTMYRDFTNDYGKKLLGR
jgi:hypothetical protein